MEYLQRFGIFIDILWNIFFQFRRTVIIDIKKKSSILMLHFISFQQILIAFRSNET
jgi:hypothetical protein